MELRQYWDLFRKWLWLIVLAAVLSAAAAYFVSVRQIPIYQASARVLVTQASGVSQIPSYSDIQLSERLSRTYAQTMTELPVLEATLAKLGLDMDVRDLAKAITVTPVRDTELIDVSVELPYPKLATEIANTLPVVFEEINLTRQTARFQESRVLLETQLAEAEAQIRNQEEQLDVLRNDASESVESGVGQIMLENRLAQYRNSYGTLLAQLQEIRLAELNTLDTFAIVGPATVPEHPVRPRVLLTTLVALITGGIIGVFGVLLIEYLDDTVKNPDDVGRVTGLSTVGVIARLKNGDAQQGLITVEDSRSPTAEAYRTIRSSIQFSSVDTPLRSLVVTSPGPTEGKSTTASNLAVVMAQSGKKTVLIDADLRKPVQHRRFGVPNALGLTGALLLGEDYDGDSLEQLLTPSGVENLWLITSGQLPHNPSELLGSQKLQQFIDRLLQEYDFIVMDSPPALVVTDSAVLGQVADGVLLVVEAGNTRELALKQTMSDMEQVNAHVIGVVLNKFKARGGAGYYYYYYNRYYSHDEEGKEGGGDAGQRQSAPERRSPSGGFAQRIARTIRRS